MFAKSECSLIEIFAQKSFFSLDHYEPRLAVTITSMWSTAIEYKWELKDFQSKGKERGQKCSSLDSSTWFRIKVINIKSFGKQAKEYMIKWCF